MPIMHNLTSNQKVIFVLGRPGSGKTLTTHFLLEYIQSIEVDISKIALYNDYRQLREWFLRDSSQRDFEIGPRGGFRVINFGILDTSLREINDRVLSGIEEKLFTVIEFSRPNYVEAFGNFDDSLKKSSTMIYLNAPLDICIRRNEERKSEADDEAGYVPPDIMQNYYREDDVELLEKIFTRQVVRVDNSRDGILSFREKLLGEAHHFI